MKKLNSSKLNTDLAEVDGYPPEYAGVFADGYYGEVNQSGEKNLLRMCVVTLRKHWILISLLTLTVTGAAMVYVAQKPDYYKASVRVQVNAENNPAAGVQTNGGSVILNNAGFDPGYFTTQLQILEGTGLMQRVTKTLDLENNEDFLFPQRGKRLTMLQNVGKMIGVYRPPVEDRSLAKERTEPNGDLNADASSNPDELTEKYAPMVVRLKRSLSVLPVTDSRTKNAETRLIDVAYTHEDPVIAAKIANAIGDAYVLQNLEQKVQTNASAGDFLQKRVAELQSEIRLGEERLLNYSRNSQFVPPTAEQNTVVQRLGSLNMQVGQAENDRIRAQSEYQAARQNQLRSAAGDAQVSGLETRLNGLRQELAQLKTEYTDDWPDVIQKKKQIETVEGQLSTVRTRTSNVQLAALQEKLNETIARERELKDYFISQKNEVLRQNEASIYYKIIQQENDTNKSLLAGLLERSRANDVILTGTPNNVLVADRAVVPRGPAGPERSKTVLLALFVALGTGCGLAFLLEWLDDSVHHSDDIEGVLGLPLLAAIPATRLGIGTRFLPKALQKRRQGKRRYDQYDLPAFDKPEYSEAYLQLRTHLMLSTAGGSPQSILVTSGEEGEGKTITALNLATSLAKTAKSVLLIDADLRWPRINLIKDIGNKIGLTTLLTSAEITDEMIDNAIQKDPASNLDILTSGERSVNPANLLSSEQMRTLLVDLSARYTHIVIDSPPVLYFADSTILSTLVDSVIIVVRDDSSSRLSVLKAQKLLQSVGAKIVGMVMNGIPRQWKNYSKYRDYEMGADLPADGEYQALKLN